VIGPLAERFTVHWYDMPGYGRSEKSAEQATSLDVQGEVFAEMLAHWQLERPSVIAHDFGGATTLRAHLLLGCPFERCVLMNVVAMRPWGSAFFDHVKQHVAAFQGLPPHIHAAVVKAYVESALMREIAGDDLEALTSPWLDAEGRHSFYRQFALADERFTEELEPRFRDIACPVEVLWGVDDPWIPVERGRALHRAIGHAAWTELAGLGHLPQLEAPQTVAAHLLRALSQV
jgi:pimeloyl-ACP methyl ester carboxylesterase